MSSKDDTSQRRFNETARFSESAASAKAQNVQKLLNAHRHVTLFPMSGGDVTRPKRYMYLALGWIFFCLGIMGSLLPVVPGTPFMVLSAWAFSKSSRRFELWLLNNRYFGPNIVNFRKHRVIPLNVKVFTLAAMSVTLIVSYASGKIPWWGLLIQVLMMGYVAWLSLRYPSHVPDDTSSLPKL